MGVNDTAEHDVCVAVGYDLCDLAFEMRFGLGDANGRTVAEDAGCQMTGGPRVRIRLPPAASLQTLAPKHVAEGTGPMICRPTGSPKLLGNCLAPA
jgi:hypothetical protein